MPRTSAHRGAVAGEMKWNGMKCNEMKFLSEQLHNYASIPVNYPNWYTTDPLNKINNRELFAYVNENL